MEESFVIGLDSSTTSVKAIVFDKRGNVVAHAYELLYLFSPQPNYYEQNAEDWWNAAQKSLKKVTSQIDPKKILSISISNQRETFVPLDKNGEPLRLAIIWLDERCKKEVEPFAKKIGHNKIHQITGKPVDYAPVVYRLSWMKKQEPKLFKQIEMICDVQTFLVWKLTGKFATSWSSADPLGLFDLKKKEWSSVILKALDLNENQLPKTYQTGAVIGKISESASKITGLETNTVLTAGGGDGQFAGLGSNILSSDRAYLNLGTAVVAGIYGEKYKVNKAFRTMSSCSENGYYFECSLRAGTFAIDWFVKNILKIEPSENPEIYTQLENEAKEIAIGSEGVLHLPYICGAMNPYWDTNATGIFIGLSASHTRGHLYRAILEGIAFEQLFAISSVEMVNKQKVKEFVVMGGGAKNDLWLQILADVTNKNIVIPESTEASSLGAGIAAAVSIGWYKTFSEAANAMTRVKREIQPNPQNYKKYQKYFIRYKKIYPALLNIR